MSSATFLNVFALLVFLANTRGALLRYSKRDPEVKTRNVSCFSILCFYFWSLLEYSAYDVY